MRGLLDIVVDDRLVELVLRGEFGLRMLQPRGNGVRGLGAAVA